ncbi:hypothetical protein [Pseudoalteromonas marina]|uniref:hypothetical protein n=1 Tax=Pseudoalteromonas marina TaxID=267375 RepID=UPI0023F2E5B4|nr:hypothetical protein [Pseudoalteromonas marina]
MRDLTEEELKLTPEWATHYFIDVDDDVIYESVSLCWWKSLDNPMQNYTFNMRKNKAINWKPFDISKHEFSDENFKGAAYIDADGDLVIGASEYEISCFCASKPDAIAIAKALGVTANDLI